MDCAFRTVKACRTTIRALHRGFEDSSSVSTSPLITSLRSKSRIGIFQLCWNSWHQILLSLLENSASLIYPGRPLFWLLSIVVGVAQRFRLCLLINFISFGVGMVCPFYQLHVFWPRTKPCLSPLSRCSSRT